MKKNDEDVLRYLILAVPSTHRVTRAYRAFEGDLRVVTEDSRGIEYRWQIQEDNDGITRLILTS